MCYYRIKLTYGFNIDYSKTNIVNNMKYIPFNELLTCTNIKKSNLIPRNFLQNIENYSKNTTSKVNYIIILLIFIFIIFVIFYIRKKNIRNKKNIY
jgi:F0F1-type ATP synthase membrane subunit a